MTVLWSYDFESGLADGTTMTTSNSAFTNLVQSGWTFSTAHVLSPGGGGLAGRLSSSVAAAANAGAGTVWTAAATVYYRFYLYLETLPTSNTSIFQLRNNTTVAADIRLNTTGAIAFRNSSQTAVATSTAWSAGQFIRVEGMVNSSSQQQGKVFAGSNVNGTTADYDSGVVTATNTNTMNNFTLGFVTTPGGASIIHWDNILMQDSGFPGPVVTTTGGMKVWNGSAWVIKPVKVWNGSAWAVKPVKFWDGSTWRTAP